ncbi:MAG: SDR family oxidoreductase, partial [Candidatus Eisenbacteria bacterium]
MDLGLAGNVALVGGASRGLGRACAEALAAEGAKTVLVARGAGPLKEAAQAIARAHSADSHPFAADLAEPDACEAAVAETVKKFGRLDVLVANAGGPKPGHVDELSDDDWRRGFELTFLTTVRLCRAAVSAMKKGPVGRGGRIVIIGSGSMAAPIPNLAISSGLRPGLRGVAKMLAEKYAPDGITVNVVAPGLIKTERLIEAAHGAPDATGPGASTRVFERWAAEIPARRLGEPEDVGHVVAFLCSSRAS